MNVAPIGTYAHRIIDAHGHTGKFFNGVECTWGHILDNPLNNSDTVDKVIISNLNGIISNAPFDEIQANEEVLMQCVSNDKFIPLAVCRPDRGDVSKINTLFDKHPNRFVGLKFHPNESHLAADDIKYEPYLKFAQKHKLPCVFHCENNQFSSPERIYNSAKKIPDTPVVLAHLCSGDTTAQKKGIDVIVESLSKGDAKLYTDISWVDFETVKQNSGTPTIIELIKKLKNHAKGDFTDRILFGTDAPIAEYSPNAGGRELYSKFVENIKTSIRNDSQLKDSADDLIDKIFYRNAEDLFITPLRNTNITETTETIIQSSKRHINKSPLIAFGLFVVGVATSIIYKNIESKKQQNNIPKPENSTAQIENKYGNYQIKNEIKMGSNILENRLRIMA